MWAPVFRSVNLHLHRIRDIPYKVFHLMYPIPSHHRHHNSLLLLNIDLENAPPIMPPANPPKRIFAISPVGLVCRIITAVCIAIQPSLYRVCAEHSSLYRIIQSRMCKVFFKHRIIFVCGKTQPCADSSVLTGILWHSP